MAIIYDVITNGERVTLLSIPDIALTCKALGLRNRISGVTKCVEYFQTEPGSRFKQSRVGVKSINFTKLGYTNGIGYVVNKDVDKHIIKYVKAANLFMETYHRKDDWSKLESIKI